MKKSITGSALALSAAALFVAAPAFADESAITATSTAPMVKCEGGNACKGQSACKTATNQCKGQNACKGKGVTMSTAEDCTKAGGKVVNE